MDVSRDDLTDQATAFRDAALRAGPDAEVPSCPGWDVRKLLRHLARVYAMTTLALDLEPTDSRPAPPRMPEEFDEAVTAFDDQLTRLTDTLAATDPARAVWAFFPGGTAESWTRRTVHETAVHRLDAELANDATTNDLLFNPELAADGVDEMLTSLLPLGDWSESSHEGRVLYHAADAGQTWLVTYQHGHAPEVGSPHDAALGTPEVDANIAGTADALFRKVWGRPSTAIVTGNTTLADLAAGR